MPDQVLIDIINEHLPYEIDMLRTVYGELAGASPPTGVFKNALIESFCIHARSLIHFLANRPSKPDDAAASDFTDTFVTTLDLQVERLKFILQKLNKQAFHLTTARTVVDKFDPGADGKIIILEIERELQNFQNCLKPEFKHFKCRTSALSVPASGSLASSSYSTSITTGSFPVAKTGPTGPLGDTSSR